MNCPDCKDVELKENISIKGLLFKKKEVVFYCPVCNFENKREFNLSKKDLELDEIDKQRNYEIELSKASKNPNERTINYNTNREETKNLNYKKN